jgi:predicted transcriptional regulator
MYIVGTGTPAYLRVVCQNAKPDKPEEYAAALKKYLWPMIEDQVKKGVASYVGLDSQYVNNMAPSTRCLVMDFPNAESMDTWATAVNATFAKMSKADRDAFFGSTVTDSRRDIMARITHSGHK